MSEQTIQKKILDYLKTRGWPVKIISCNRNGTPDILACVSGRFVAIEVKSERGRVSPLQAAQIRAIREAGGIAGVARSVEDAEKILREGLTNVSRGYTM